MEAFSIFWVIFVIAVGSLAHAKNRSVVGWIALAIFFTPIVGIILLCLPKIEELTITAEEPITLYKPASTSEEPITLYEPANTSDIIDSFLDQESKKCPACAEFIKLEAKKCRFCGEELDPDEVKRQIETRRVEIADRLAKQRKGKKQCPQCGSWDLHWAVIEGGGMGHWCDNCKKSLNAMGVA
jgi:hypothetical protein